MIIGGHHRHAAIGELRKDMTDALNLTSERIPVYYNILSDGPALSALEKMNNSTSLN